jgi:hypothetical protein
MVKRLAWNGPARARWHESGAWGRRSKFFVFSMPRPYEPALTGVLYLITLHVFIFAFGGVVKSKVSIAKSVEG